ncbi:hypothetical protein GCM10009616_40330 [Microlunatus lacustris]
MPRGCRKNQTYDPASDLAARWPKWRIKLTDLAGVPHIICADHRLLLIDPTAWPEGEEFAATHSIAHLDLGHAAVDGMLSREQEDQADWLAQVRLDEEGSRECA